MRSTSQQLTLNLVKEIVAKKEQQTIHPCYALATEIQSAVRHALDSLVRDGTLIRRVASVNRIPAYEISPSNNLNLNQP